MSDPIQGLALYEYRSCPYCARVRDAMARLGIEIESRNIQQDRQRLRELVDATGRTQVPCLRIDEGESAHWLHESVDIIRYLEERVVC